LKEFEISSKSDSLKLESLTERGMCFYEKSQYQDAAMEFERAVKFAAVGSNIELGIRYNLADCHEKIKDIQSAINNWEKIFEVAPGFRDVQHKLAAYEEFRQDDRIKDFMIAGLAQFEIIARKMAAGMNFNIVDLEVISDIEIEILVTVSDGKWHNTKHASKIIRINRTTDILTDAYFRTIYQTMKAKNAIAALIITTGDVSPKTLEFIDTRPIEIMKKNDLIKLLKKI
jgi:tetratricopeptide (TPR) repeat protein